MNTKTIITLLAVAAVLLGGVWYLFTHSLLSGIGGPAATTTPMTATSTASTTGSPTTGTKKPTSTTAKIVGTGPYTYLIGLKQPLICNVTTKTGYKRTGTMYIANGRMRANFTNTSMVSDDTYLYVWTNGATKGLMLLAARSASGSAIAANGGIDPVTDLSYSCNPWVMNFNTFVPPASVVFSDTL